MARWLMIGIFLAAIAFVIVQMINFFLSINSGSGQHRRDTAELKAKIAIYLSMLVPMSNQDMEELSTNKSGNSSVMGVARIDAGTFQSIFHEPLLAYAVKTYRFPADKRVLLISGALSSHPVRIGNREVGEIVNVRLNESPNPRAYQFIEPMNEQELDIFRALTYLSLAEESLS